MSQHAARPRPSRRVTPDAQSSLPRGAYILIAAYLAFVPIIVVHLTGSLTFGAVDLLFPFASICVLRFASTRLRARGTFALIFLTAAVASTISVLVGLTPVPSGANAFDTVLIIRVVEIYTPFFVVILWPSWTPERGRKLTRIAIASGLVVCMIGIMLHHAGIQMRDTQQVNWYANGIESTLRAGGLLGNSADFGHLAALLGTAALTLGVVYSIRPWIVALSVAVAAYATLLSTSRAAMLHLVVALTLMIPILLRGKRALASITTAFALFVSALLFLSAIGIDDRFIAVLERLDVFNLSGNSSFFSSNTRVGSWDQMIELITDHPFFGIGYGMTLPHVGNAGDNSFLSMIVEVGIIGGIAYCAFWFSNLVQVTSSPRSPARTAALALIVSEMSHMLTVDTHRMWATTPYSLILIALAIRQVSDTPSGTRSASFRD